MLFRSGLSMRAPDGNGPNVGSNTSSNTGSAVGNRDRDVSRSPVNPRPSAKVQPKAQVQTQARVQPEKQIEQKTEKQLGSAPAPSLEDLKARFGRKV